MAGCLEMIGSVFDGLQKFRVRTISPDHFLRRPGIHVAAVFIHRVGDVPIKGVIEVYFVHRVLAFFTEINQD